MQTLADRSRAVAIAVLAACLLLGAWDAPAARADGDPASDVLLYQPIYFPYQPAPAAVKRRLTGLVRSANSQGYQIRVAIVQSRRDLGSITQLFDKPPSVYAQYLSAELSGAWHYRVLVVFPNGYGLAEGGAHFVKVKGVLEIREDPVSGPDKAVIRSLRPPSGSSPSALIAAAGRALRALAARHDVSLVVPSTRTSSGGGGSRGSELLAAAVSATVGLTAGLLWYLWRTRPAQGG